MDNSSTPVTMKYAGPADGGPGTASLTKLNATQYHLSLSVAGNPFSAGVEGVITKADGNLYEMTTDSQGNSCDLSVTFLPQAIQIDEVFGNGKSGCSYDHGASLSFDERLLAVQ